jgi:hypothetical protein
VSENSCKNTLVRDSHVRSHCELPRPLVKTLTHVPWQLLWSCLHETVGCTPAWVGEPCMSTALLGYHKVFNLLSVSRTRARGNTCLHCWCLSLVLATSVMTTPNYKLPLPGESEEQHPGWGQREMALDRQKVWVSYLSLYLCLSFCLSDSLTLPIIFSLIYFPFISSSNSSSVIISENLIIDPRFVIPKLPPSR